MKVIATGDWHIGNVFHGIDRIEEHRHFLAWLVDRVVDEKPDLLLVAGDVFDNNNPSAQAQTVYFDFLASLGKVAPTMATVIISGNHDSGMRLQAPKSILQQNGVEIRGGVPRIGGSKGVEFDVDSLIIPVDGADGIKLAVIAVPYLRSDVLANRAIADFLRTVSERCTELHPDRRQILMCHMYASGAEIASKDASERIVIGGEEEVNLGGWDEHPQFMVCGHIHKRQRIWGTDWARYPGSVLPMSFAERGYTHGVDLIEISKNGVIGVRQIEYPLQHKLVSLPDDDSACGIKELKKLIRTLPKLEEGTTPDENAVYLELKVTMDNVSNEMVRELEDAVKGYNAILCKIQKVLPTVEVENMVSSTTYHSVDEIINRDAMDVLRESFKVKYQRELSASQEALLQNVLLRIRKEE